MSAGRAGLARVPGGEPGPDVLRFGQLFVQEGQEDPPSLRERMEQFSPDFCRTFCQGASAVLRSDREMFRIFRSSTKTTSWVSPIEVEIFSWVFATWSFSFRKFFIMDPSRYSRESFLCSQRSPFHDQKSLCIRMDSETGRCRGKRRPPQGPVRSPERFLCWLRNLSFCLDGDGPSTGLGKKNPGEGVPFVRIFFRHVDLDLEGVREPESVSFLPFFFVSPSQNALSRNLGAHCWVWTGPAERNPYSDNGAPMKGATMLGTLQMLGIRPSFGRPSGSLTTPILSHSSKP